MTGPVPYTCTHSLLNYHGCMYMYVYGEDSDPGSTVAASPVPVRRPDQRWRKVLDIGGPAAGSMPEDPSFSS